MSLKLEQIYWRYLGEDSTRLAEFEAAHWGLHQNKGYIDGYDENTI